MAQSPYLLPAVTWSTFCRRIRRTTNRRNPRAISSRSRFAVALRIRQDGFPVRIFSPGSQSRQTLFPDSMDSIELSVALPPRNFLLKDLYPSRRLISAVDLRL